MIDFVTGKPGGGKTLYAVSLIVRELVETQRPVVTNVSLKLDELNAYLQERHPSASVDLARRVVILEETQLSEFYRYRGAGKILGMRRDIASGSNGGKLEEVLPDLTTKDTEDVGCFFVLDEVHVAFSARQWTKINSAGLLYYLSQHRKLNDDVLTISQSIELVDKQFRLTAQAFHVIRNQYLEKFKGMKLPGGFVRRSYLVPPTSPNAEPYEYAKTKLDRRLAACYDTSGGVGIAGRGKPETAKKVRGLPLWTLGVALAAILIAAFYVPDLLAWSMTRGASRAREATASEAVVPPASPARSTAEMLAVPAPVVRPSVVSDASHVSPLAPPAVRVVGIVEGRGGGWVELDDGTRLYDVPTRPGEAYVAGRWRRVEGRPVDAEAVRRADEREAARRAAAEAAQAAGEATRREMVREALAIVRQEAADKAAQSAAAAQRMATTGIEAGPLGRTRTVTTPSTLSESQAGALGLPVVQLSR